MRRHAFAVAVVGLSLGGCATTTEQYVKRHGSPTFVEEHSGAIARRYPWGVTPNSSWRIDYVVFEYVDRRVQAVFKDNRLVREEPLDD